MEILRTAEKHTIETVNFSSVLLAQLTAFHNNMNTKKGICMRQ